MSKFFVIFAKILLIVMKEEKLRASELLEQNVKQIARVQHRSLAQIAKEMGISAPSLTHLLKGNPQLDRIQKIADTLNVPISALFRDVNSIEGVLFVNGVAKIIRSKNDLETISSNQLKVKVGSQLKIGG